MKFLISAILIFIFQFSFTQIQTKIIDQKIEIFQLSKNKIRINTYAKKTIYSNENNLDSYFHTYYQEKNKPKIKYIKIYDKHGVLLKNVNKTEVFHTNASSSKTLYSDRFICYYELKRPELPYVIEYEFETIFEDILDYPDWNPQANFTTVKNSSYIIHSLDVVNHKSYNFKPELDIDKNDKEIVYTWSYSNDSIMQNDEDYYYAFYNGLPKLITNSSNFLMQNIEGSFNSWKEFGNFYYYLNENRKSIPINLEAKLLELKAESNSEIELLESIYVYLQNTKRYISITLDLSGYQSMTIDEIDKKSYGDCKALSNYLETCLNYVGIESYSALVQGKRNVFHFEEKFVSNQFNHVICCAILEEDTIWLESTSNKEPINFLGSFTSNRPALIIKEDNSKLVRTPAYENEVNFSNIKVEAILNEYSEATLNYSMRLEGLNQNLFRNYVFKTSDNDIKDFLNYYFEYLGEYELLDYKVKSVDHSSPIIDLEVQIKKSNFYQKIGTNYLINLNVFSPLTKIPTLDSKKRKTKFLYPNGIKENFEVSINFENLPGNKFEVSPINKKINTENIKAIYDIKLIDELMVVQTLNYSINTFESTAKDIDKWNVSFKKLNELFDTKIIVKLKNK